MRYSINIFFEKNVPDFFVVKKELEKYTGLEFITDFYDNEAEIENWKLSGAEGIVNIDTVKITHYCDITYSNFSLVTIHQTGKENKIVIDTDVMPPHYIFEMVIYTLKKLGGRVHEDYTQPDWVGIKWKNKKWWQRIPR